MKWLAHARTLPSLRAPISNSPAHPCAGARFGSHDLDFTEASGRLRGGRASWKSQAKVVGATGRERAAFDFAESTKTPKNRGTGGARVERATGPSQKESYHTNRLRKPAVPVQFTQCAPSRRAAADEDVVAVFESQRGAAVLARIVLAAVVVMVFVAPGSVRSVALFLRLSGLGRVIGCSRGAVHALVVRVRDAIARYEAAEKRRISTTSGLNQKVTLCLDELFRCGIAYLVVIDSNTNFVFAEEPSKVVDIDAYERVVGGALEHLPVEIEAIVGDQGSAIEGYAAHLEIPKGNDLFHPQHDITKGTSVALRAKENAAREAVDNATTKLERCDDHEMRAASRKARKEAEQRLARATKQRETMREIVRTFGSELHPFDFDQGAARSSIEVSRAMRYQLEAARQLARNAGLSEQALAYIDKADRAVEGLTAPVDRFHARVTDKLAALNLAPLVEAEVRTALLPALYLRRVAQRIGTSQGRKKLRAKAYAWLTRLHESQSVWSTLKSPERTLIVAVVHDCIALFQRSSSCVEGRNSALSLRIHALRGAPLAHLRALTTVHNFLVEDDEGLTPAERLFGLQPTSLFDRLLNTIALPGPPGSPRPRSSQFDLPIRLLR